MFYFLIYNISHFGSALLYSIYFVYNLPNLNFCCYLQTIYLCIFMARCMFTFIVNKFLFSSCTIHKNVLPLHSI